MGDAMSDDTEKAAEARLAGMEAGIEANRVSGEENRVSGEANEAGIEANRAGIASAQEAGGISEGRISRMEADIVEAGVPTDDPHHAMATDVAKETVKAGGADQQRLLDEMKVLMGSAKWFIVVLFCALVVVLLVR